jgi:DNA-binding CsgD family transcriptional regulator/PAS domain-containing protein
MGRRAQHDAPHEGDLLELVERAYAAVVDPALWPAFLDRLGASVAGIGAGVFFHDGPGDTASLSVAVGLEPRWERAHAEYFVTRDVRRPLIRTLPHGAAFRGQDLLPDAQLLRTEFYNEFLRPQGFFHIAGCLPLKSIDGTAVLRVLRPRGVRAFGPPEIEFLRVLGSHLTAAFRLHRHMRDAAAGAAATRAVLDWLPTGIILLDRHGRVVTMNERASDMIGERDGLVLTRRGLVATSAAQTRALGSLIAEVTSSEGDQPKRTVGMALARPSGRQPLNVLAASLPTPQLTGVAGRAVAVLFVGDPTQAEPSIPALRRHLGVTTAEATLALALARGMTVDEAAIELNISKHTARTHLKRVLQKAGVHRQADLVRLVLQSPAQLAHGRR